MYCCPSSSFASKLSSLHGTGTTEYLVTRSLEILQHFSLQFDSKIHLVCNRKFRTTSFSDPNPSKDQWPRENLSAYSLMVFELFTHNSSFPFTSHPISLNIDMKMILPVKFSGSHCNSPIICWIWLRIPTVVNSGKIFHSNSIGCPSIRLNSLK